MRNQALFGWTLRIALTVLLGCSGVAELDTEYEEADLQNELRIWSSTTRPAQTAAGDSQAVELGVKFRSDVNGQLRGVRFYKGYGNHGQHRGSLWSSDGQLLATALFANETNSGWQRVRFTQPVSIRAGVTYIASYHAPMGHYAYAHDAFANQGVDSPPLHALRSGVDGPNGVFRYGASAFPNSSFRSMNYWVDVIFSPDGTQSDPGTPVPDAGTPPPADAGTMPPRDAGTSVPPDAGTPPASDAGTPTCVAGAACTPSNRCHTGTITCSGGNPVCTDTGTGVTNGTSCGTGLICTSGVCGSSTPPPTGGFPDATNTGPEAAGFTNLQPYTGPQRITVAGTVISGKIITQVPLYIQAANVTIQGCRIVGSPGSEPIVYLTSAGSNAKILDSEIRGVSVTNTATEGVRVWTNAIEFRRNNVYWLSGDGMDLGGNSRDHVITDNFIHDFVYRSGAHVDLIQTSGTMRNILLRHNTFDVWVPGAMSAVFGGSTDLDGITVDNNLWAGGGFVFYGGGDGSAKNCRYTNNHFSTKYSNVCGYYGLMHGNTIPTWGGTSGNVWSGNVWSGGTKDGQTTPAP